MSRAIALTFDDGPDPEWTPRVLAALETADVTAMFFVMARNATSHPGLVRSMRARGHAVELHCTRHVRHTERDEDEIEADTHEGLTRLRSLGVVPTRWRTPWGIQASFTQKIAQRHGLALTGWTADSYDWTGDSAETMLARIAPDLGDGSLVLMHDGIGPGATREGCAETVRLVGMIASHAEARGLVLA